MADNKRLIETLFALIDDALENVHTATIARVEAVNGSTVDAQPVVARKVRGETRQRAPLKDVPVLIMQGGDSYSAPPIAAGDYVLVVIVEHCFDRWWDGQDGRPPLEPRRHDYSDAIAIAGFKPLADAVGIPSIWTEAGDREQVGDHNQTGNKTIDGSLDVKMEAEGATGSIDAAGNATVGGNTESATYSVGGKPGASGTFITADSPSKTVTVVNGIITSIV